MTEWPTVWEVQSSMWPEDVTLVQTVPSLLSCLQVGKKDILFSHMPAEMGVIHIYTSWGWIGEPCFILIHQNLGEVLVVSSLHKCFDPGQSTTQPTNQPTVQATPIGPLSKLFCGHWNNHTSSFGFCLPLVFSFHFVSRRDEKKENCAASITCWCKMP